MVKYIIDEKFVKEVANEVLPSLLAHLLSNIKPSPPSNKNKYEIHDNYDDIDAYDNYDNYDDNDDYDDNDIFDDNDLFEDYDDYEEYDIYDDFKDSEDYDDDDYDDNPDENKDPVAMANRNGTTDSRNNQDPITSEAAQWNQSKNNVIYFIISYFLTNLALVKYSVVSVHV